ncbi:MAG: UbiX family flavin prenyltransferase [Bacteroidota bacterium]
MKIVVGITGSSGAVYAVEFLKRCPGDIYLVMSKWGKTVMKDEMNLTEKDLAQYVKRVFVNDDLSAPIASGSNKIDAMVIIPASTSTIGKIASGIGDSLLTRAAQVALKERYTLIICVRETPLSTINLEQLTRLSHAGAIIMPISPPLYFLPKTVDEYVQGFVDRVLHQIGAKPAKGWRSEELE